MGFIDEADVRRVKEATDLVALIGEHTKVVKAGSDYSACCPFHPDKTPSMHIYVDQGTWHCFSCKAHGDAISFLRERERLEFSDAVQVLAKRAGIAIEVKAHSGGAAPTAAARDERSRMLAAVEFAARFYRGELARAPDATAYLGGRGILPVTSEAFGIGWAPGRGALVEAARQAGIDPEILGKADLAGQREGRWQDRFFDRITFPIHDRLGHPIGFSARLLPAAEKAAKERGLGIGKYVNSAETAIYRKGATVYNLHRARLAAKDTGRLILMEAQTGCAAAHQVGILDTVSTLGTALTSDQCREIAKAIGPDGWLTICLDGDAAGADASAKAVRTCLAAGLDCQVVTLPTDTDPAELLIEHNDADQPAAGLAGRIVFDTAVAGAIPGLRYLCAAVAPTPADLTDVKRLAAADDLIDALRGMPDLELRDLALDQVARHLGLKAPMLRRRAAFGQSGPNDLSVFSTPRGSGNSPAPADPAAPPAAPRRGLDDQGNAERFVERHGANVRYCFEYGAAAPWFVWTGHYWRRDKTQEVNRLVIETLNAVLPAEAAALREEAAERRRRGQEGSALAKEREADQVETWHRTSRNQRKIEAVLTVAQKEPGIGVSVADLNRHDHLIACPNGQVDLRDGTLHAANRADLITRCAGIDYKPGTSQPRWEKFLAELTGGDTALVSYLQRAAGYSLTGSTAEEKLFMVYGPGGSGKSTFISAIDTVLGELAETIDFELFLASNIGKRETYYAAIEHARFVQCEESGDGKQFAADVVKKTTGGNKLQARHLYGSSYGYTPKFKVWLVTNERPRVSDLDGGVWRRLDIIHCAHVVPAEARDKTMKAWLRGDQAARESLLAWIVQGAIEYHRIGLAQPAAVTSEVAAYRRDSDPLQEFLDDRTWWDTAPGDDERATSFVPKCDFNASYLKWVEENNAGKPLSGKSLSKRMEARGAFSCKKKINPTDAGPAHHWKGLRLRDGRDDGKPANAPNSAGVRPADAAPTIAAQPGTSSETGSVTATAHEVPASTAKPPHPAYPPLYEDPVTAANPSGRHGTSPETNITPGAPSAVTAGHQNPARAREDTAHHASPLPPDPFENSVFPRVREKRETPVITSRPPGEGGSAAPPPPAGEPPPGPDGKPSRGERLAGDPADDPDPFADPDPNYFPPF